MKLSRWTIPLLGTGLSMLPVAAMAEGMPQLDFSTPLTTSQVVWGAIIFALLYWILSRAGLPLVASVLEERGTKIARDLDEARAAKASADAGMAEADQATAKARAEAQAAINAALDEAKKKAAEQAEALNARLEKRLQDSEAQIAQARVSAMSALRQVATETATTVVTRLTGTAPDAGRLDTAIGSALAARGIG
ncbi:F0F1 ATP synthase subunit B' [Acidisphaera sp. S103]|uniref:F0F1 ATP synthase subunit B family protein n=1 Tax=Acidisphaera sp. S103 TaxID=1747223 RepID=UPI00131C04DD|nr:F0F1 ATP synthase subunit B' [Acidisphaera sp. S103]